MMMQTGHCLHHEDLDVYKASIAFLALSAEVYKDWPRGHGALSDQLKRASLSIPLNIAEGYGKKSRSDQARFYHIARGSAHECGAVLDASRVLHLIDETKYLEAKRLLYRIVSMLVRLADV